MIDIFSIRLGLDPASSFYLSIENGIATAGKMHA